MAHDPADDQPDRSRPSGRGCRRKSSTRRSNGPAFCIEMIDGVLMDCDYDHRVVAGVTADDGVTEEWIELEAPTDLYVNARGEHRLAVTIRIEAGLPHMMAIDVYPSGSLRSLPSPSGGVRQLLWLAASFAALRSFGTVPVRNRNRIGVPRFVAHWRRA